MPGNVPRFRRPLVIEMLILTPQRVLLACAGMSSDPSKTRSASLRRVPSYFSACGLMSRYSCPPVFFCLKTMRVNSPNFWISPQVCFSMSLLRCPVRHEKRNVLFVTLAIHVDVKVHTLTSISQCFLTKLHLTFSVGCCFLFCHFVY